MTPTQCLKIAQESKKVLEPFKTDASTTGPKLYEIAEQVELASLKLMGKNYQAQEFKKINEVMQAWGRHLEIIIINNPNRPKES